MRRDAPLRLSPGLETWSSQMLSSATLLSGLVDFRSQHEEAVMVAALTMALDTWSLVLVSVVHHGETVAGRSGPADPRYRAPDAIGDSKQLPTRHSRPCQGRPAPDAEVDLARGSVCEAQGIRVQPGARERTLCPPCTLRADVYGISSRPALFAAAVDAEAGRCLDDRATMHGSRIPPRIACRRREFASMLDE